MSFQHTQRRTTCHVPPPPCVLLIKGDGLGRVVAGDILLTLVGVGVYGSSAVVVISLSEKAGRAL